MQVDLHLAWFVICTEAAEVDLESWIGNWVNNCGTCCLLALLLEPLLLLLVLLRGVLLLVKVVAVIVLSLSKYFLLYNKYFLLDNKYFSLYHLHRHPVGGKVVARVLQLRHRGRDGRGEQTLQGNKYFYFILQIFSGVTCAAWAVAWSLKECWVCWYGVWYSPGLL